MEIASEVTILLPLRWRYYDTDTVYFIPYSSTALSSSQDLSTSVLQVSKGSMPTKLIITPTELENLFYIYFSWERYSISYKWS